MKTYLPCYRTWRLNIGLNHLKDRKVEDEYLVLLKKIQNIKMKTYLPFTESKGLKKFL